MRTKESELVEKMSKWVDVTNTFSEEQRYYKDLYLEINEVYDEVVEVSLFSCKDDLYEIYFSFGIMYGIIYAEASIAYEKREEVKKELEAEYNKHKEPTKDFINDFADRYEVCLPNDLFFDFDISRWCEQIDKMLG
jgi:hypothetical protein